MEGNSLLVRTTLVALLQMCVTRLPLYARQPRLDQEQISSAAQIRTRSNQDDIVRDIIVENT
jgi:hypothetical protein